MEYHLQAEKISVMRLPGLNRCFIRVDQVCDLQASLIFPLLVYICNNAGNSILVNFLFSIPLLALIYEPTDMRNIESDERSISVKEEKENEFKGEGSCIEPLQFHDRWFYFY